MAANRCVQRAKDYARSNPFKSCDSINIARNAEDLSEMLHGLLHIEGEA